MKLQGELKVNKKQEKQVVAEEPQENVTNPPQEQAPEKQKLNMDALTQEENFPAPSENAIAAFQAKQENAAPEEKKKRGRPKGSGKTANGFRHPAEAAMEMKKDSIETAAAISSVLEAGQMALISHEFKYSEMERAANIAAWKGVLDHYEMPELHPVAVLMLSHGQIMATRAIQGTETKTKMQKFGLGIKEKWQKWRNRKNARNYFGKDNERENNVGEKESGQP